MVVIEIGPADLLNVHVYHLKTYHIHRAHQFLFLNPMGDINFYAY